MDPNVRDALIDIKNSVKEGFSETNRRLDDLVTKSEFNATIQRIDEKLVSQEKALDNHERQSDIYKAQAHASEEAAKKDALDAATAVRTELHAALSQLRTTSRWAVGITATVAGIIVSVVTAIIKHFSG